jgi:hypothetical protein
MQYFAMNSRNARLNWLKSPNAHGFDVEAFDEPF